MKKPKVIKLLGTIRTKADFLNDIKINSLIEKEVSKIIETDYKNIFISNNILNKSFNIYINDNRLIIRYSVDYTYLKSDFNFELSKPDKLSINRIIKERFSRFFSSDFFEIKLSDNTVLGFKLMGLKYKEIAKARYFLVDVTHEKP